MKRFYTYLFTAFNKEHNIKIQEQFSYFRETAPEPEELGKDLDDWVWDQGSVYNYENYTHYSFDGIIEDITEEVKE